MSYFCFLFSLICTIFNLITALCALGFSKLLEKLVKYPLDKDYKERQEDDFLR